MVTPEATTGMQAGVTPSCTTPFGEEPGRIHRSDRQACSMLSSHALLAGFLRAPLVQAVARWACCSPCSAAVQVHSSGGQWSQVHLPLNGAVQSPSESPLLEFVLTEAGQDVWDKPTAGRPSAPAPCFRVWRPHGGGQGPAAPCEAGQHDGALCLSLVTREL